MNVKGIGGEVTACFKALFSHFPIGTEETITSIWAAGLQFEILARNITKTKTEC
jgi:hypothetical protein